MGAEEQKQYETARAIDSSDDRPVQELTKQEMELFRRLCPNCDPTVHELSNLNHSHGAYANRIDAELHARDS